MGKRSKATIEKRSREKKKAEKAAMKREARALRGDDGDGSPTVATADDLAGYGLGPEADETDENGESKTG